MIRVACFLLLACSVHADTPLTVKSTTDAPPKTIPDALRSCLQKDAYIVADAKGPLATFWLRRDIPAQVPAGATPAYQHLAPTTYIGLVQFARSWVDYHAQEADAGCYTLRLAIQPKSKDHEGTAPHREFCILSPIAKETKPDVLPIKTLITNSGSITGGTHPVVMMLHPVPKFDAANMVRRGKAGHALHIATTVQVADKSLPLAFGFNVLGTGTDE